MDNIKLTRVENSTLKRLQKLADDWPDDWMLFSANGALLVVEIDSKRIIASITGIPNDGGDPDTKTIDENEYLDLGE